MTRVIPNLGKEKLQGEGEWLVYRLYLYYVAMNDPVIYITRVRNRVVLDGQPLSKDRIICRNQRFLSLLLEVIMHTSGPYIFDNSTDTSKSRLSWLVEVTDGQLLELKPDRIPARLQRAVIQKIA